MKRRFSSFACFPMQKLVFGPKKEKKSQRPNIFPFKWVDMGIKNILR
jgi:hypothetical protein